MSMDDIAVIGVGLRFPGDATSPEALWDVLENGRSQWSEIPRDRLNIDGYYHPGGERQGSISFRGAHFLAENVAAFDAPFFSIGGADAEAIDPQQRFLLEVCYEALENAGCTKESIDGSDTSVYVGSFVKDYEQICLRDPDWQPQYAATGNGIAIMANRISYFFNLHGPSMTLDTGCSGSLVSVHLAAQSLRTGESSLAIAAGAGMILTPNTIMPMTALNFLSPDGKCFTFDSRANGYGRGEGVGAVILKRMSDAIRDNDTIRAVIRGTRVNQDGRTTGITLPSKEAQVANIRAVYKSAELCCSDTAYVECHGTGTQAGDWRELKAISETLGSSRSSDDPILVGSVKPNIGHLEGAAGVAGLIKAILMLERQRIPPHINFETPNPDIDFVDWKVQVSRTARDWPTNQKKRVSVNCFGFGGTNAHVILDGAAEYLATKKLTAHHSSPSGGTTMASLTNASDSPLTESSCISNDWQIFCFSAHERSGIMRMAQQHLHMLERRHPARDFLPSYAYTLGCRRSQLEWKAYYLADSVSGLKMQMRESESPAMKRSTTTESSPKLCFLFSGQGSQWARMGLDLCSYPVFWNSLRSATWYLKTFLGSSFDLIDEISRHDSDSLLAEPHISQPATTAIQVALVDLMRSFSIEPDFVLGHSSGEIAAAFACGAISREEAWEVAYYRGLAAIRLQEKLQGFCGGMIAVSMTLSQATEYSLNMSNPLEVACINSPNSITLSGKQETVEQVARDLKAKGIQNRPLSVKMAYHSSYMKKTEDEYVRDISSVCPSDHRKAARFFSSVTGDEIHGCQQLDASYWGRNMTSTVQFSSAIESLMALPDSKRPSMFIEMGPSTVLRTPVMATLPPLFQGTYLSALDKRRSGMASVLDIVGSLWTSGYKVNLHSAISRRVPHIRLKCLSDLPAYPWNHTKSYWHESHLSLANRFRQYGRLDLIGAPTADSVPFEPRWRGFLRISENPWTRDHQIQKTVIYPAAGVVAMVLEGARQLKKDDTNVIGYEIRDMRLEKAITIADTTHGVEVALNMRAETDSSDKMTRGSRFSFCLYSKNLDKSWEKHVAGTLCFCFASPNWEARLAAFGDEHSSVAALCPTPVNPRQLYEHLNAVGISYGPMFRNIVQVSKGDSSCISRIRVPDTRSKMPAGFEYPHLLHPATLDSMFQTLFALQPVPKIPYFIQSIFVSDGLDLSKSREFIGHATARVTGAQDAEAQISMCCTDRPRDQVIIKGLRFSGNLFPQSTRSSFLPNHRNLATQLVWRQDADTAVFASLRHAISLLSHKYPSLAVLQIGASLSVTKSILLSCAQDAQLPPRLGRFTLASSESGPELDELLASPFKNYLEIVSDTRPLQSQYHLIVISEQSENTVSETEHLLRPRGTRVLLVSDSDAGEASPTIIGAGSISLGLEMQELQMEWLRCTAKSSHQPNMNEQLIMRRFPTEAGACKMPGQVILLLPESVSSEVLLFRNHLQNLLSLSYPTTVVVALSLQDAAACASLPNDALFISLLEFSSDVLANGFVFDWSKPAYDAFHTLHKKMKTVIWITRAASMQPTNPRAAAVIGLARTLMSENLQVRFVTFDLGPDTDLSEIEIAGLVFTICRSVLDPTLAREAQEMDFAEKNGKLYIPRLEPLPFLNRIIEEGDEMIVSAEMPFRALDIDHGQSRLELANSTPELSESAGSRPYFVQSELGPISAQQVRVSFSSAVLHGRCAMLESQLANNRLCYDVVGHVTEAGHDVAQLQKGDKVVALVPNGRGICTTLQIDSAFVLQYKPGFVPSHFLAAYHALFNAGRLRKGTTILVQNAATGFGLAAIELALLSGAIVFATVAGEAADKQSKILQKRGVRREHILDGSDDGYASVIELLTNHRGVDIVYNPTRQNLHLSIACVRQCGTVVHFIAASESPTSAIMHSKPVTMVSFDLNALLTEDGAFAAETLRAAAQMTAESCLDWLRDSAINRQFDMTTLQDAFELCGRHDNPGSVSVVAAAEPGDNRCMVNVLDRNPTRPLRECILQNLTYVLVGGLGGLGRRIAQLLVANGAKHLTFLSRSGASSASSSRFLEELAMVGVNAKAFAIDICDKEALQFILETEVGPAMPPIAGVFYCAAVIKDSVFENMTHESWETGFRPKAMGAWNLVQGIQVTGQSPFYVFLASSAGIIGTRGQANYAAANSFLDSLAKSLQLCGQRAVSLDLGPILGAGMLAEDETILDILRASGFYGIRLDDFLTVMKHAVTMETLEGEPLPPQVILGVGTGGLMLQNQPADPYWSRTALYSYLNTVDLPEAGLSAANLPVGVDIKLQLANCVDKKVATDVVCSGLSIMLAKSMNITAEEIDTSRPPTSYGVDSLIAVGVRNWVAGNCAVEVSVFEVMSELTVLELSKLIVQKGGFGQPTTTS